MPLQDYDQHMFQLGSQTLEQLAGQGLPPTPENYTVWFSAVQGFMRPLNLEWRALKKRGISITQDEMAALYEKYFVAPLAVPLCRVEEFNSTIVSTNDILKTASQDASSYGGKLDAASNQMESSDPKRIDELIQVLTHETQSMRQKTLMLQSKLEERSAQVAHLHNELTESRQAANIDQLTGIGNRRLFDSALREAIEKASSGSEDLSILMIDVDHFKLFNDRHGHQIGDVILRLIAGLLEQQIKGQDVAARFGGEEFAIILPETKLTGAVTVANQICQCIASQRPRIKSKNLELDPVTLSIGVAEWDLQESSTSLVERADKSLYHAKASGRNCVRSQDDLLVSA